MNGANGNTKRELLNGLKYTYTLTDREITESLKNYIDETGNELKIGRSYKMLNFH
jgi:hypothetical protein